jgi:hypothetical protein
MTELDQVIANAYATEGKQDDVNKVYLTLIRTPLFLPVQKEESSSVPPAEDAEPFKPLFAKIEDNYFLLAFDTVERLTAWAGDQMDNINFVEISGRDMIAGISDQVFLCLNYGTDFYKEFVPDEVKRLKMIVSRIDQMKTDK